MGKLKYKQGTAKIGNKEDYTNTAKSLTKEEKAEFAKLDNSGKAFSFKGLQYAGKINFPKAQTSYQKLVKDSGSDISIPSINNKGEYYLRTSSGDSLDFSKPSSKTITASIVPKTLNKTTPISKPKNIIPEFNLNSIISKKKELANLRSSIPGFGPFRSSTNSKLVENIDNINRQLYKISQKQSAFERNKLRGLANEQAIQEARAREIEFKNLTKNLKLK